MRDILFRGKRLDNGVWVYGSLLQVECEDGSIVTAIFDRKILDAMQRSTHPPSASTPA